MRALRVVGLTEDGEVVLEDPVRLERYTVPADERLRAAARGDLSRLGQIAIELESQLRPREIQARIRAGASVEQVATAAGVPEQKIERFAYPVLTERFRTADNAQRAHPMRADGPDSRTLAEVVAHTLGLRGQAYEGAKWDSWKGEDGRWVVALSWRAGRSDNRAHWVFQPGAHGGTVTALDEHASDLVEGLPARPLRTVGAVVDMTRPEEEPPPAPSPVEQWRAAASDSYREQRLPTPSDTGRRTPAEPWRPAPPQRQSEPPAAYRPTEPLADPRPAGRGAYRDEPLTDPRPAAHRVETRPNAARDEPSAERRGTASAEWAPWERGASRIATQAPGDVAVPAARTAPVEAEVATPPVATPAVPATPAPAVEVEPAPVVAQVAEPSAAEPAAEPPAEPRVAEPPADGSSADEPSRADHSAAAPPAARPSAPEPPEAERPEAERPEAERPEAERRSVVPPAAEPSADEASPAYRPAAELPATTPSADEPSQADRPAAQPAANEHPVAEPPATEPSADEASPADRPAAASDAPAAAAPAPEPSAPQPSATEPAADAPAEPAAKATPGTPPKRTRKGKPVMPSWDEVLLGVRGPR